MSEEWCDFNDMPKSSCAHCRQTPELSTLERPELGPVVIARFDGECAFCHQPIEAGKDHIGRIDDEGQDWHGKWAHYGCGT